MDHSTHAAKGGMGRLSRFFYYDYSFFRHVCEKYRMVAGL